MGLFEFVRLQRQLAEIVGHRVDLVTPYELMLSGKELARGIDGYAEVDVWGAPSAIAIRASRRKTTSSGCAGRTRHPTVCKPGIQTIARQFAVTSRGPNDDAWIRDEIYLHLKVSFAGLVLEAQSVTVTAAWAG